MIYAQLRGITYDVKETYRPLGRAMEFYLDTEAEMTELRALHPIPSNNVGGGSVAICLDSGNNFALGSNGWGKI